MKTLLMPMSITKELNKITKIMGMWGNRIITIKVNWQ